MESRFCKNSLILNTVAAWMQEIKQRIRSVAEQTALITFYAVAIRLLSRKQIKNAAFIVNSPYQVLWDTEHRGREIAYYASYIGVSKRLLHGFHVCINEFSLGLFATSIKLQYQSACYIHSLAL